MPSMSPDRSAFPPLSCPPHTPETAKRLHRSRRPRRAARRFVSPAQPATISRSGSAPGRRGTQTARNRRAVQTPALDFARGRRASSSSRSTRSARGALRGDLRARPAGLGARRTARRRRCIPAAALRRAVSARFPRLRLPEAARLRRVRAGCAPSSRRRHRQSAAPQPASAAPARCRPAAPAPTAPWACRSHQPRSLSYPTAPAARPSPLASRHSELELHSRLASRLWAPPE